VIFIAQLKLQIIADLKKLKSDLDKFMKEKFKIGIKGDKAGGLLGKIGLGKLALISAGVLAIGAGIKKLVKGLAASSPYLKGVFSMFKRASMQFFRPFGDFLATLLKPLAIVLLRATSKWLTFTRGIAKGEDILGDIKEKIDEFFGEFDFGEWLIENIPKFIIGLFDFGEWLGLRLADFIVGLFNFGVWLGERLADFVVGLFDFGVWLGGKIAAYIKGEFDLGEWLGDNIDPFFEGIFDVGEWIGEQIGEWFFVKPFKLGEWLGEHIKEFIIGTISITDLFKSLFEKERIPPLAEAPGYIGPKGILGEGQKGIPFVPKTGLYKLHRGEEVTPKSTGRTRIFKPTFNFLGNMVADIDIDSMMRRASREAEINLRRFTAI